MHTWYYRANALLTLVGSALGVLCILTTLTDLMHKSSPQVDAKVLEVTSLWKEYDRYIGTNDKARLTLDMTADLRSVWTWNTKQVYLSVHVAFGTEKNHLTQAVIWNVILQNKEDALVREPRLTHTHPSSILKLKEPDRNAVLSYPFELSDQGTGLRGLPYNVTVQWNMMPLVGVLFTQSKSFTGSIFPTEYLRPERGRYRQ